MDVRLSGKTLLVCVLSFALYGFFWGDKDKKTIELDSQSEAETNLAPSPIAAQNNEAAKALEETLSNAAVGDRIPIGDRWGNVKHQFADEDSMRNFATLWQQRRGMLTRVAVLQAYLSEEQLRIEDVDEQFQTEFGVEADSKFVLDSDRRLLIELEELPEEQAGAAGEAEETATVN